MCFVNTVMVVWKWKSQEGQDGLLFIPKKSRRRNDCIIFTVKYIKSLSSVAWWENKGLGTKNV